MAIGYFPVPCEDELFYSVLARYNYDVGNKVYRNFSNTFFTIATARADMEFVNHLSCNTTGVIFPRLPLVKIIHEHTMYDYYTAFVPAERRERAYNAMLTTDPKLYRPLIPMPEKQKRFLRWCPRCVEEDREKQGYTYWHRSAQMQGIELCPIHSCTLINTPYPLTSKTTPVIISAEEVISESIEPTFCASLKEIEFVRYCYDIFTRASTTQSLNPLPLFLQARLVGTPYLSVRKQVRDISRLYADVNAFCDGTNLPRFTILSQLQLIFKGARFAPYEIALLGFFLGVRAEEMVVRDIPEGILENTVDDEIRKLHQRGHNYAQISRMTGVDYDIVKLIDYGKYGKNN